MNKTDNSARLTALLELFKKHGGVKILLIVIVGIALLLVGLGGVEKKEDVAEDEIEARLEELCSSIAGVGRCEVMVTYERSTSRYNTSDTRRVESVAIACKGADSVSVRSELTKLFTSLFGIGANRVSISRMK